MTVINDTWGYILSGSSTPWNLQFGNPQTNLTSRKLSLTFDDIVLRPTPYTGGFYIRTTVAFSACQGNWGTYFGVPADVSKFMPGIQYIVSGSLIKFTGMAYNSTSLTTIGDFDGRTIPAQEVAFEIFYKATANLIAVKVTYQGNKVRSGFVASSTITPRQPCIVGNNTATFGAVLQTGNIYWGELIGQDNLSDAAVGSLYSTSEVPISFGGGFNFRPWPTITILPAIQWIQDSAGYWNGSDRGASQDAYEATAVFSGTEGTINALEANLDYFREAIELNNFIAPLFAPNVDHTGTINAVVLGVKRTQIQFGNPTHIYALEVRFRAIATTLLSTTPSLATLRVQDGFDASHSYESPKAFTYGQTAVYGDRRSDIGTFEATFSQKTAEVQAILAYLLTTARANSVAFPAALSTVAYPWGRTRGAATNCKVIGFTLARKNLNRWTLKIKFTEAP